MTMQEHLNHLSMRGYQFVVICRSDRKEDGTPGPYSLATRRVFGTTEEAEAYATGISASREAIVVTGMFTDLRFSEAR